MEVLVNVRDARPEDAAGIEPLLEACGAAEGWAEANIGGRSEPNRNWPHVDLVAETEGRIVGWVSGDVICAPDETASTSPAGAASA